MQVAIIMGENLRLLLAYRRREERNFLTQLNSGLSKSSYTFHRRSADWKMLTWKMRE